MFSLVFMFFQGKYSDLIILFKGILKKNIIHGSLTACLGWSCWSIARRCSPTASDSAACTWFKCEAGDRGICRCLGDAGRRGEKPWRISENKARKRAGGHNVFQILLNLTGNGVRNFLEVASASCHDIKVSIFGHFVWEIKLWKDMGYFREVEHSP